jgi:hypothetical protein
LSFYPKSRAKSAKVAARTQWGRKMSPLPTGWVWFGNKAL